MRKRIFDYELIDHGIDSYQYFRGCGIANTPFHHVVTGCGSNPAEAVDDALDLLAQDGYELDGLLDLILQEFVCDSLPTEPNAHDDCPVYVNRYRCVPCGNEWDDTHSSTCNDRCSKCNAEIKPFESEDNDEHAECELYYYVSIRVKEGKD